ncbi:hypothetical protein ABIE67_009219 [Streptomyces sp. V4I8]|uniref:hypothetical protein n=1 Tax=Streptomyces sp. V4I8 TaxID=3156469 RepID=UPI0035146668
MNIIELLADLQAQHDQTAVRAGELRDQIAHLTVALAETEAHLTDLATTRKVIAEAAPAGAEPDPPETSTAYQANVNAFNQHPDQEFRARELHELLGMPTHEASVKPAAKRPSCCRPGTAPSGRSPSDTSTRNHPGRPTRRGHRRVCCAYGWWCP